MELQSFDEAYFKRLRAGDPATCDHFVAYFNQLLLIKLRSRLRSPQAIEDVRQETFARVLTSLRNEGGIRNPASLGSFVNSVCNNVLLEHYRSSSRNLYLEDNPVDPPDKRINMDEMLITEQTQRYVREILDQLSKKDRRILHAIFIEEKHKDHVCQEFGVNRDYLRVLLHRAKQSFRARYEQDGGKNKTKK
ncbi:MAG TPA: sigma-70 family RNA polymerase sigma factor [Terriglobales bacterium]|nr:sigma-70 family RNA polymerase sigma factor [Terriglobales bacterium]